MKTDNPCRARRQRAGRQSALWRQPCPRRSQPGYSCQPHGGPDRPRRRRQVQPDVAADRRAENAGGPHHRSGRRHRRRRASPRCLSAHCLHAARAGQEPVSHAVGIRKRRFLRPLVRPRSRPSAIGASPNCSKARVWNRSATAPPANSRAA